MAKETKVGLGVVVLLSFGLVGAVAWRVYRPDFAPSAALAAAPRAAEGEGRAASLVRPESDAERGGADLKPPTSRRDVWSGARLASADEPETQDALPRKLLMPAPAVHASQSDALAARETHATAKPTRRVTMRPSEQEASSWPTDEDKSVNGKAIPAADDADSPVSSRAPRRFAAADESRGAGRRVALADDQDPADAPAADTSLHDGAARQSADGFPVRPPTRYAPPVPPAAAAPRTQSLVSPPAFDDRSALVQAQGPAADDYRQRYQSAPLPVRPLPDAGDFAADRGAPVGGGTYTVEPNDTFWTISERVYGSGAYFKALAGYNREKYGDGDTLAVGDVVQTPPVAELAQRFPQFCPKRRRGAEGGIRAAGMAPRPAGGGRQYEVRDGDTLFEIARYELGDGSRWVEIYQLNRQQLTEDFHYLKPGTVLALPGGKRSGDVLARERGATTRR